MPFETGPHRYQPPGNYPYASDPKLRFDQRRLARLVGIIALGLSPILGLGGLVLERFRAALSGYYYEQVLLGDLFVGSLAAIGALLMAYRGWTPKVAQLASLAGIACFVVAFVPMDGWFVEGRAHYPRLGYWVHAGAAGVLFSILSFFCLFVFTKVPVDEAGKQQGPSPAKRRRNAIYKVSGIIIALSAISIGVGDLLFGESWNAHNLTFWAEALILTAFGVSWLTQGRALAPLADPQDHEDAMAARSTQGAQMDGALSRR